MHLQLYKSLLSKVSGDQGAPGVQSEAPATPPEVTSPASGGPSLALALNNNPRQPTEAEKAMAEAMRKAFGAPSPTPTPKPTA